MNLPKIFHSMYIKWTLTFISLLLIAQAMTAAISFRAIIEQTAAILVEKIQRKSILLTELYSQGEHITTETLKQFGVIDIEIIFLSDELKNSSLNKIVSLDMLNRALDGEIVLFYQNEPFYRVPHSLLALETQLLLLIPILPQNELKIFVDGIARAMLLNIMLSSIFVSGALLIIILKIRKVTAATREVSRGNFNIELFTRSTDEVGELMRNFNIMTKELRQIEYLKKDFVSSISHEFKTPITAIEGFAKLLKNKNLSEDVRAEYTDIIIKETARLGGLSTNLLRLSLLDNSESPPEKQLFYLDEQIRSTILLLERAWEDKNISFDIQMEEILYNGNEELLSQVWINLLQNAIKFSSQNGIIGVNLFKQNAFVVVEISDTGCGISPIHQDKIFTRFYKANKTNTEGNGLGLPIAKRIIELCGGEIGFTSEKNKTIFTVKLPIK